MTHVELDYGAATHRGRIRDRNEDAVLARTNVFVVADGVGGHAGGGVAAASVVHVLSQLVGTDNLDSATVVATVERANATLLKIAEADPTLDGMATTLAMLILAHGDQSRWIIGSVGDSRVYRFATGQLVQLSTDHSEVNELVAAGALTAAQARRYPRRHVLTRSLGRSHAHHPDISERPLQPVETYLICSDGLTSELPDRTIAHYLSTAESAQARADALVSAAVHAGGHDNVTAVVVTLGSFGHT